MHRKPSNAAYEIDRKKADSDTKLCGALGLSCGKKTLFAGVGQPI
jgi:hypothetical protein